MRNFFALKKELDSVSLFRNFIPLPKHGLKMAKYGQGDASYLAAGGEEGIRKLVDEFYVQMETQEKGKKIRAMHTGELETITDKLSIFLTGWMGGPRTYAEKYGRISIPMVHRHLDVTETERDAWLFCMTEALKKQDYEEDFREYLIGVLAFPAERIRQVSSQRMRQDEEGK